MVCWSDNLDWRRVLGKLGMTITEEEKSKAIWELQDEMGHDNLRSMPVEERERLMIEKLEEMKGLRPPKHKKQKKGKKEKHVEEEEEPAQSFYM
nr:hypothetical protein [Candidatus Sigynarchaeota archaeon]